MHGRLDGTSAQADCVDMSLRDDAAVHQYFSLTGYSGYHFRQSRQRGSA